SDWDPTVRGVVKLEIPRGDPGHGILLVTHPVGRVAVVLLDLIKRSLKRVRIDWHLAPKLLTKLLDFLLLLVRDRISLDGDEPRAFTVPTGKIDVVAVPEDL